MNKKYNKEMLEEAVKQVTSIRQLINFFKLKETGGSYTHFNALIRHYNIDTLHFLGQGWAKGQTNKTNSSLLNMTNKNRTPDSEVFIENAKPIGGDKLKRRLLDKGWKDECKICNSKNEWCGKPLTIQVDHINGIHNDNRFENLRLLCPNCHSQTSNWSGKNIKKSLKTKKSCSVCGCKISSHSKGMCMTCYHKTKNM